MIKLAFSFVRAKLTERLTTLSYVDSMLCYNMLCYKHLSFVFIMNQLV